MIKLNGDHWVAEQINSEYYHLHGTDVMAASHRYPKKNFIERRQVPLAMCVKVDDEHRWVAAGYGDGTWTANQRKLTKLTYITQQLLQSV
ncbi:hypothetical protein G6F57_023061 [Rhizopus arrhizus]|nr:hypothetical protein G6F57_023061 [Rhizopus arrhizus]